MKKTTLLLLYTLQAPIWAMDSLRMDAYGLKPEDFESARLVKTYGMDKDQADRMSAHRFPPSPTDAPRKPSAPSTPSSQVSNESLEEVKVKAEAHVKTVTVRQVEYTKRQLACYSMASAIVGALVAGGTTLAIHFSNCK